MSERAVRPGQVKDLPYNLPNLLVNPDFEIWQRGAGPWSTPLTFTADEWQTSALGGGDTITVSQEASIVKSGNYSLKVVKTGTGGTGINQGIEQYKSLEGLTLTFSAWVRASSASVQIFICDWNGSTQTCSFASHSGSGGWERLTVVKTIRTGLVGFVTGIHNFGIRVGIYSPVSATYYIDGAMLVVGNFPEGIPFVRENRDTELQKCKRFFDMGELSVTGVEKNVRNWQATDNLLINPDLEIWQRGAGPFVGALAFTADEWQTSPLGGGDTITVTRESSIVKNGAYSLKVVKTGTGGTGMNHGIENYKDYEGLTLTFSAWVYASSPSVNILLSDRTASAEYVLAAHSGSGTWERLTCVKTIRSGLIPTLPTVWPHGFPLRVGIYSTASATYYIDSAMLVVGNYPEGVPFIPPNPQDDATRCYRFYYKSTSPVRVIRYSTPDVDAFAASIPGNGYFPVPMYTTPTLTTYPNSSFTSPGYVRKNIGGVESNSTQFNHGVNKESVVYWNDELGPLNSMGDYFYCWYVAEVD